MYVNGQSCKVMEFCYKVCLGYVVSALKLESKSEQPGGYLNAKYILAIS